MEGELDMVDLDLDAAEDLDVLWAEARRLRRRRGPRGRRAKRSHVFRVIGKTAFDYTFLAPSTSTTVTLRRALRLPPYFHYWFGLRVHNMSISRGSFSVGFWNTLPSREDPQEFTDAAAYQTLTVAAGDPAPPQLKTATDSFEGPYCKIVLTASQGTGTPPLPLYAELSVVLHARAS
jgi:hypothetical protein